MLGTDMHHALAHYRYLIVSYGEEDLDSMPRLSDREWQGMLEQAAGDAFVAGATRKDLQEIEDDYP